MANLAFCVITKDIHQTSALVEFMVRRLFNAQDAVIPTYFQRVLLSILLEEGVEEEKLLLGLQLSRSDFTDDDCRISPAQNIRFVKNALSASKDPHLGWRFGKQIQVTTLGILGYAVMSSGSVISAVNTLTTFFKIREPSFDLNIIGTQTDLESRILYVLESYDFGEIRYFMLSCIISAFNSVFKSLTHETTVIKRVEINCEEPESWQQQAQLIQFPIVFNCSRTRIFLDEEFLTREMPAADPHTERTTIQICQQILNTVENQSGIIKEVNEFIIKNVGGYPSLTDTANYLNMSPRTLRRKLSKSGTTYQQTLDSIRASIAKELLLNTTKMTSEIAIELGYNDASNFNRAFKVWTGVSPGQFRR